MERPPVEIQYNQWSCALACFVWWMKQHGWTNLTQENFVRDNALLFWDWNPTNPNRRDGALTRGGLLDLMQSAPKTAPKPIARKCVHTNLASEFQRHTNQYHPGFVAGYIYARKPTDHCVAVLEVDGDKVVTMDPSSVDDGYKEYPWGYWEKDRESDFMAFYL